LGVQLIKQGLARVRTAVYSARHKLATGAVGVLLLLLAYHAIFGVNGLINYQQKRKESQELEHQIEQLEEQNGRVEGQIKALKSDPQAIEKEARERLRYARPGEMVYTLPAAKQASPPVAGK
jgi:cell division protein FtsB